MVLGLTIAAFSESHAALSLAGTLEGVVVAVGVIAISRFRTERSTARGTLRPGPVCTIKSAELLRA